MNSHKQNTTFLNNAQNLIDLKTDNDNAKKYYENTLRISSLRGHFDVVKLLLDAGADKTPLQWSPLFESIVWGTLDEVKDKLTLENLEKTDAQGRTPFLLAVQVDSIEKAKWLIEKGANKNALVRGYTSALIYATKNDNTDIIQWLFDLGVDINERHSSEGTSVYVASHYGKVKSLKYLLSLGADIEHRYESISRRKIKNKFRRFMMTEKSIARAYSLEIIDILIEAGADIKDISNHMRMRLLRLNFDASFSWVASEYHRYKKRVFGKSNPELVKNPFWLKMIKSNKCAGGFRDRFDDNDLDEPIWCYERFGRSISVLDDGRIIEVGGEHEDHYMPDFCIYNDVTVFHPQGHIEMYTYPKDIFAPTDNHTATLVEENIYIIGNLGYFKERNYGTTPVYRLNLHDYSIKKVETTGKIPGWIYRHKASFDGGSTITISGGEIQVAGDKEPKVNYERFALNLESMRWIRL